MTIRQAMIGTAAVGLACLLGGRLPTAGAAEAGRTGSAPRLPRALLAEGLWTDVFRLREACHAAGVPYTGAYKSRSPFFRPNDRLIGMPDSFAPFDVIVLGNVDAGTLGAERLAAIRRFVEEGGGLVVLGGYWAYSRGAYGGTPLEDLLPADMPAENRIAPARAGLPLTAEPGAPWPAGLAFGARPCAFFVQTLAPRPGSVVWLKAGDKPAVISGSFGKGRVVAVALTVNGEAPDGVTAFWDWPDWPVLLGALVDWAASGPRPAAAEKDATPLTREERVALAMGDAPESVVRRARAAPTADVAEALLDLALSPAEGQAIGLAEVGRALIPFAKPAWAERLADLTLFSNPDLPARRAALALLGATRAPEAQPLLARAMTDKVVRNAAIEGLGLAGDVAERPRLRKLFEETAREARGGPADGPILPDLFAQEQAALLAETAIALYRLGDPEGVPRLVELYGTVHLYHRIFQNAGKRRVPETDLQGLEIRKRIWEGAANLGAVRTRLLESAGPVPATQSAALARAAAAATDPVEVEWFLTALDRSAHTPPEAEWAVLKKAQDGIIARLAAGWADAP